MSDVNPCFSRDIWSEILKNLPLKTLGKCRCVCKSWHSLIVSPSFMASHLKHYTQNNKNTLLLYREMSPKIPKRVQYLFFLHSGRIPLQLSHTSICPYKLLQDFEHWSYFVGSIHGLICLSDGHYLNPTGQIMLWNPFLRKMMYLPMSMVDTSGLTSVLGFAYDNNKNDHKVVKISYSRVDYRANPLVEVYSVLDRMWKDIPSGYLVENSIRGVSCSHCFLNGVVYWLTLVNDEYPYLDKWILLFDVVEETFQKIELPEAKKQGGESGILEYKSKLSVSHCGYFLCGGTVLANCQIWIREDESWCMILNVVLRNRMHIGPINYLGKNGELYGFKDEIDGKILFYDPLTKGFSELCLRQPHLSAKFAAFTESLVLLNQDTDVYTDDDLKRCVRIHRRLRFINNSWESYFSEE